MQLRRDVLLLGIAMLAPSMLGFSQGPPPLPKDPTALMTLARDKNGLTGADIKPWHMRGTYHFYKFGKLQYEGTYEEWWFSPTQYKLTFSHPGVTQTDYATGTALLRDGAQEWLNGPEILLRESLVDPLPDPAQLKEFKLKVRTLKVGDAKLECAVLRYKTDLEGDVFPRACFESTIPVLRVFSPGFSTETRYDNVTLFQGHYIAHQIQVHMGKTLVADLNIDSVESLNQSPNAFIAPPTSALPVDLSKIVLKPAGFMFWPMRLIMIFPDIPPPAVSPRGVASPPSDNGVVPFNPDMPRDAAAELNHPVTSFVHGAILFKFSIGPDGHVEDAQILDGPMTIRAASLEAARQWVFRPFVIMGQPRLVESETSIGFGSTVR